MKRGFLTFDKDARQKSLPKQPSANLGDTSAGTRKDASKRSGDQFSVTSANRSPAASTYIPPNMANISLAEIREQVNTFKCTIPAYMGCAPTLVSTTPLIYHAGDYEDSFNPGPNKYHYLYGPGSLREMVFIGSLPRTREISKLPTWSRPGAATSLAGSDLKESPGKVLGYVVKEASGKGLGIFATKEFNVGDLVLSERPLAIDGEPPGKLTDVEFTNAIFHNAVENLEGKSKASYRGLTNNIINWAPHFGIRLNNGLTISSPPWTAASPFDGCTGVFNVISRINHSCTPNVAFKFDPGSLKGEVFAVRPIVRGEELQITYIRLHAVRNDRRNWLLERYKFACECSCCALGLEEQGESDKRRKKLFEFEGALASATIGEVKEAWEVANEEGLGHMQSRFIHRAIGVSESVLDFEQAQIWRERGAGLVS
ncbi:hypothetical protein P7C70_g2748, partial [Phenoliferia sp. Uapishka_3]